MTRRAALLLCMLGWVAPLSAGEAGTTARAEQGAVAAGSPAGPGTASQPVPAVPPIDLATALRVAVSGNLDIALARARLHEAEGRLSAAEGGLLPSVAVGAGYQHSNGWTSDAFGNFRDAQVNFANAAGTVQLTLNVGESLYRRLAARRALDAEHDRGEATRQQVLLAASTRYSELVTAVNAVAIQEDLLKEARGLVAIATTRNGNGLGLALDSERAKAQAAEQERRLLALEADRRRRAVELAVTLQLDPASELAPLDMALQPAALIEPERPLTTWLAEGERSSPQAAALTLEWAARQQEAHAVRWSNYGPQLALNAYDGGYSTAFGELDDHHRNGWAASVGWTLSLSASGQIAAADARSEQAGLALAKVRLEQRAAITAAYSDVAALRRQLDPGSARRQAAENAYRIAHARFAGGFLPESDLLLAEQDLEQARFAWIDLVARYNVAQFRLLAEAGIITIEALTAPSAPAAGGPGRGKAAP